MAKKKVTSEENEGEDVGVATEEKATKKTKNVDLASLYISANSLINRKTVVIPVSPVIDVMLGGGVPEGSFVIPTGPPKVGKSTFSLQLAANAIRPEYACELNPKGREVFIFNIEGRLKKRDLEGINGLDINKVHVIGSEPGNIISAEDYIERGERLINERPGDIFIFDSFSQLCTVDRMTASYRDRFRDNSASLLAAFCKRICNVIPINRSIVIGITHLIANQGGMGHSPWSEASGQKIQYAADIKIKATHQTPWKVGETQIGQEVHWKCTTSAIGPPGGSCSSLLRYGYGLDKEAEIVTLAADFGIIKKGGAWYTMPDEKKFQGLENTREYLVANPTVYEDIYRQIREMLGQ